MSWSTPSLWEKATTRLRGKRRNRRESNEGGDEGEEQNPSDEAGGSEVTRRR